MGQLILFLITILSLPLMLFNFFAGIVGCVWLVWIGDWSTPVAAFVAGVVAPFVLSFPLMLSLLFAAPAVWLFEKGAFGKLLSMPFILLAGLVTWVVMAGWGLYVFAFALGAAGNANMLPYLLIAYSVTTGPWAYMASKEGPDANVGVPLIFTQLGAAWGVFAIWLYLTPPPNVVLIYLLIMGFGFLLSVVSGLVSMVPLKKQDAVLDD